MNFITDIAIILIAAGLFTIISRVLNLPRFLGYVIAGVLLGPRVGIVPISSMENVEEWSEIGLIFLLFTLGLELNFYKLKRMSVNVLIAAGGKIFGMLFVGVIVGLASGHTVVESVFLGSVLSMSSSVFIERIYHDMGVEYVPHAKILFDSLKISDLVAMVLMVVLTGIVLGRGHEGVGVLWELMKLLLFLVLCFGIGITFLPVFFRWVHKYVNDEVVLIVAIGLCFAMVELTVLAGFSVDLGAFIMGAVLSCSMEGERIEKSIVHIRDLFAAIFFVSIGMMVDPMVVYANWQTVLILSLITIVGGVVFATVGGVAAGEDVKTAVQMGLSQSMLGEFAFIIAALGCSLGVLSDFIHPVIVTVSVITTFVVTFFIKWMNPLSECLCSILPSAWKAKWAVKADNQRKSTIAVETEWKKIIKSYVLRMIFYGMVSLVVLWMISIYAPDWMRAWFPHKSMVSYKVMCTVFTLLIMSPFLLGMVMRRTTMEASLHKLENYKKQNRHIIHFYSYLKVVIAALIVTSVFYVYFHWHHSWLILVFVLAFGILYATSTLFVMGRLERLFVRNLNSKEAEEKEKRPITAAMQEKLARYDVRVEAVEVQPEYRYIGKTLREMPFRHVADVNVVEIRRGNKRIRVPAGGEMIYPHDILVAVGTTEQLNEFRSIVAANTLPPYADEHPEFEVRKFLLPEQHEWTHKTLRQIKMRSYGCMVVSIMREGNIYTNPLADDMLLPGDMLWIAGEKENIDFIL